MCLMSTYGGLLEPCRPCRSATWTLPNGTKKTFRYMEPFANHFDHPHIVDDHNNNWHSNPSIEGTWIPICWAVRVFAFLLAITEVNVFFAFCYFAWKEKKVQPTLHEFCRAFALALIHNEYLPVDDKTEKKGVVNSWKRRNVLHELMQAPRHASRFDGRKWICNSKARYQQFACRGANCKNYIGTYCGCDPSRWLCQRCHQDHLIHTVILE